MQTIEEIRSTIYDLGKLIDAPLNLLSLPDIPIGDGTPHLEMVSGLYHYVSSERGIENARKKTSSIDEFLYWFFSDVTSSISFSYELTHRLVNQDSRRLAFSKQLELLETLNPVWSKREKNRIKEILQQNPYDDDIDFRVSLCVDYSNKGFSAEDAYEKACKQYPLPKHTNGVR